MVIISTASSAVDMDCDISCFVISAGGRLNFQSFETDRIDDFVEFMRHLRDNQLVNGSQPGELCVMATGGGAFKFYDKIRDALGVDVSREEEMECLIIGKLCKINYPYLR